LIFDCHSFPSWPLPVDQDQTLNRPDICIGVDEFHTPTELVEDIKLKFENVGFCVEVNQPYSGTLVPLKYFGRHNRVKSIMIEINRALYLENEPIDISRKEDEFRILQNCLSEIVAGALSAQ